MYINLAGGLNLDQKCIKWRDTDVHPVASPCHEERFPDAENENLRRVVHTPGHFVVGPGRQTPAVARNPFVNK